MPISPRGRPAARLRQYAQVGRTVLAVFTVALAGTAFGATPCSPAASGSRWWGAERTDFSPSTAWSHVEIACSVPLGTQFTGRRRVLVTPLGATDGTPPQPVDATDRLVHVSAERNGSLRVRFQAKVKAPVAKVRVEFETTAPIAGTRAGRPQGDAFLPMPIEWTQVPIEWTQVPIEWTQVPIEWTQVPIEWTQVPIEFTQVPIESTQVPIERRTSGSYVPIESTEARTASSDVPIASNHGPIEQMQIPIEWTSPTFSGVILEGGTFSCSTTASGAGVCNANRRDAGGWRGQFAPTRTLQWRATHARGKQGCVSLLAPGSGVVHVACDDSATMRWDVALVGLDRTASGTRRQVVIRAAQAPDGKARCLADANGAVEAVACGPRDAQRWYAESPADARPDTAVQLRNAATGQCLRVADDVYMHTIAGGSSSGRAYSKMTTGPCTSPDRATASRADRFAFVAPSNAAALRPPF